jgi:hypothetical protein
MQTEKNQKGFIEVLLIYLLWPFLGVFVALRNIKSNSTWKFLWLYCGFTGLTFTFYEGGDATRYAEELSIYYNDFHMNLFEFFNYIFTDEKAGRIDFVQPLLSYLLSRFTDAKAFLYLIYGLFSGYFYSKNITSLIEITSKHYRKDILPYLVLFALFMPVWSAINGFRFWTATYILIYGVIQFLFYDKKGWGIFWILFTPFLHDSFIISIALLLVVLIIGNRINLFFGLYFISFFLSKVDVGMVKELIELLPAGLQRREGYVNEDYIEQTETLKQETNWYIRYQYVFMDWLITSTLFWLYFYRKKEIQLNPKLLSVLSIALIFFSFTNFAKNIPSVGRFAIVGDLFVLAFLFIYFQNIEPKERPEWYKALTLISLGLTTFWSLWTGAMYWSISSFLGNPITFWFFEDRTSVYDLIKTLLGS